MPLSSSPPTRRCIWGGARSGAPQAVAEYYTNYTAIQGGVDRLLKTLGSTLAVALGLLFVLQLPIARRTARALSEQNTALERKSAELAETAESLRVHLGRLATLHEIDAGILASSSSKEIARGAIMRMTDLVPCERAMILRHRASDGSAMVFATDANPADDVDLSGGIDLADFGDAIDALRRGEPYVSLASVTSGVLGKLGDLAGQPVGSFAIVPLLADKHLLGTLWLLGGEAGALTDAHLGIAREIANQIAIAIDHAELLESERRGAEELRRLVGELRRAEAQRTRLLARLVGAQEEERRRIASDIHDDTIQKMTATAMRLDLALRDHPELASDTGVSKLQGSVRSSIERLRRLMFELRPPALDTDGLAPALRAYLDDQSAIAPEWHLENRLCSEPPGEARVVLYRIAQEALTNVRKHAQAARVTVRLSEERGGYLVRIEDDGAGFAPGPRYESVPGHLGLSSMRERAEMVGGWLRIEAVPGSGTTVEFWVPGPSDAAEGVA